MCVWQCVYAAGGQYNGEWRGDQRSGHGVLEAPDGSVYTGNFDGGVRAGSGELTHRTPVRVGGSDAHPLEPGGPGPLTIELTAAAQPPRRSRR